MKMNNKNSAGHSNPIQNKIWKQMRRWKSQFIVSGVVVIFAILSFLNETLDFPHLLGGALPTPINWAEIVLDVVALFLVGSISIFMLSIVELRRKRAEEKIKHLNLVLRAIHNVNQLITHEKDHNRLLKGVCNNLVETRGYHNAWIAVLDESRRVITTAEAGLGKEFLPMVERLKRGELPDCGRRTLEQSGVLTIEDPSSTCADCPLSKNYYGRGAMTVRLEHGGKVYGLLSVSIPAELTAEKEEQALFQEVAEDIAFALHSIEQEEECKRAEENLKEAYDIINRSPTVAFLWKNDEGWPVEFVSDNVKSLFGYTAEEFTSGKVPYAKIVHPDDLDRVAEEVTRYSEEKGRREFAHEPYRIITKEGKIKYVDDRTYIRRNEKGRITHYQGIVEDITERKRAEETLRESEEKWRSLVENAPNIILIANSDGTIQFINRTLPPATIEETIGKSIYDHIELQYHHIVRETIQYVFQTGEPGHYEIRGVGPQGTTSWYDTQVGPIKHDGKVVAVTLISTDITERKKAEEEAIQHTKNMEFLSKAAMGFMELPAEKDIYRFIGEQLRELIGDAIYVLINSFDQKTRRIQARAFLADDQDMQVVSKTLGTDPMGMSFVMSDEAWNGLISGKLVRVPGGIYELSFGKIPKTACDTLEKLAGTGDIFVMGFSKKRELYGSATIIMREGCELRNTDVVETFIRQAGVALQRKRAEEALRLSEDRLKKAQAIAHIGGWDWNIEENTLFWSDELYRIFGVDRRTFELSYESIESLIHPDDRDLNSRQVKRLLESADSGECSFRAVRPDGKIRCLNQIFEVVRDDMGTAVRAFGTIQDITERKRAEEELRESEEFNTSLLNNSPNPIVVINPDTSVRYVNPALKELTGFSSAEIIGRKAPYPWWTEETLKKTSRDLEEAMRKGANKVEELFQKKNGERFWVEITSTPVKSKGELKYYLANWVDITERKRAEEKIRAEKEFSERLIVTANAIIVGLDQEHRIQLFSEGAERITGYKAEEVMGKDWFEIFFKKEMYPEIIKVWNNAWGKDLSSYTNPIYSKTGKEIIAQWSNTTIVDDKKEPILLLCIAVDITEQKKMEAQLIQSERLSAVGTLAYGIAHEFNNILAGILGNAEFGMGNDDPKEVEKCFRIIMESCDRAAGITNSLLAFSRQRQAKRGKADVTEVVETVLDLTERELEKQNIKVVRKFKPIPEITCDLGELSGVVLNMITNARDAMKPDGGTLTIEIGKKKDNIEIIFTDTGCGIPDSIKSRIFEPFVTTKGALGQSEIPGTGLGLFLSYGIISRYHGKIGVKSEEGKGSTFTIKIPISKNQESPVLFEPEEEKPTAVPQNLNILLVDDEEPICTAVKKFFENKGHSVTTALSGKKGYEIFKKGSFDLVLADITMPDMDGVELISQLKKIDQQVKFIVLTGHIAEEKLESAKKAGADEILMKPFRNEELYQTIGKVLSV